MSLSPPSIHETPVRGVRLYEMPCSVDPERGHLSVGELPHGLPFQPQRYFLTYGVPGNQTRGQHAHRRCSQFLLCTHGECHLLVDDGIRRVEFHLDRPTLGVFVPPLIWSTLLRHSADSVLLVLASLPYDEADYIREYEDFLIHAAR
jgi:UDP-2-acetamido-3-amino-2,3-dideoxy-glucuronate N-acetyltransferase